MFTPDRRITPDHDEEKILRDLYEEYPDRKVEEWECLGCGNIQDHNDGCNRCGAFAMTPIHE